MRKSTKVMWWIFAICFVGGISLMIAGLLAGGDMRDVFAGGNGGMSCEEIDVTLQQEEVKKLDIDVMAGNITIKTGDSYSIKGEGSIRQTMKDTTWHIEENYGTVRVLFWNVPVWHFWNKNHGSYEITIPQNACIEEMKLEIGAGKVEVSGLQTENFAVDLGAGDFNGEDIAAEEGSIAVGAGNAKLCGVAFRDTCKLEVGMGNLDVEDGDFTGLNIDNGTGNTNVQAKLHGKMDVDNGVGNIEIICQGEKENYAFDIDNGIGTIKINGEKCSSGNISASSEEWGSFYVDNGVGDIHISFE